MSLVRLSMRRCVSGVQQLRLFSQRATQEATENDDNNYDRIVIPPRGPMNLEEARSILNRQVLLFGTQRLSFYNVDPKIQMDDGIKGDVIKGLLAYRLRLLKYEAALALKSTSIRKKILKSVIDEQKRTVTIDFLLRITPGWRFVFFYEFWKLRPGNLDFESNDPKLLKNIRTVFHLNENGHILQQVVRLVNKENILKIEKDKKIEAATTTATETVTSSV